MPPSQDLDFMRRIRDFYISRQSNQFLLSGNVDDICRLSGEKDETDFVTVSEYLIKRLATKKRLVITYNIARGVVFENETDRDIAKRLYLTLFDMEESKLGERNFDEVVAKSAGYIFPALVFLRKLCQASTRLRGKGIPIALIVEHADSILPSKPIPQMNDSDRQRLIFFKEWFTESDFTSSDHLLILVSRTASSIHESIRSLPMMVNISIPLPDENERQRFIEWRLARKPELVLSASPAKFAEMSAGMTLLAIEQLVRDAQYRKSDLTRQDFLGYLNRHLINEIGDYIELVHPDHTLRDVVGNTALKKQLSKLTKALKSGRTDVAPVGILISGPNGVGKTYVTLAWAAECERIVLVLKNLRSSFFGETDQIFEKIRSVLEVLGNVMIIVDEADTMFGKPGGDTHETEQRLFGNVIKMMGDTRNRSKIIWVLMTARPDNLAPDLKRAGRCGLHFPMFDPEGEDREEFVDFVLKECGMSLADFKGGKKQTFLKRTEEYSPADFRELIVEIKTEALASSKKISPAVVLEVVDDFLPSNIGEQRREQTLQAIRHCSRKSLLPQLAMAAPKMTANNGRPR